MISGDQLVGVAGFEPATPSSRTMLPTCRALQARILKYENETHVTVNGLGSDERFDVGFVDSPQGYAQSRKVLPGCEDCNRLNTTLFALNRCKVVYLHDAHRDLEWNALGRINRMGYRIESSGGKFAKINAVAFV